MELSEQLRIQYDRLNIRVPDEIVPFLADMRRVRRFHYPGYRPIIIDTVLDHTVRCVNIGQQLTRLPTEVTKEAMKVLWVHDIPELVHLKPGQETANDIPLIAELFDPEARARARRLEAAFAQAYLSPLNLLRFNLFEQAGHWLRGEPEAIDRIDKAALVAKVIDAVESHMTHHYQLALWVQSPRFQPELLPADNSLTLGFRYQYQAAERLISLSPCPIAYQCWRLVLDAMARVNYFWQTAGTNLTPPAIATVLQGTNPTDQSV